MNIRVTKNLSIVLLLVVPPALLLAQSPRYNQAIESVTVTLGTVKDNSIYAESDNSNGQGIDLFAGRTQGQMGSGIRRALIKFDLTDSIPTNTVV